MKQVVKEWILPLAIIGILYYTGLLTPIAGFAQGLLLKTGLFDARIEETIKDPFDYNQKVNTRDGKTISLEDFKGKVIFLNLWASWCGPCRAEMKGIENLSKTLQDQDDIVFILLSIDKNSASAKAYIEKNGFGFNWYHWNGPMTDQLKVPSIPTTYIIDKQGFVISRKVGMVNYDTRSFRNFLLKEAGK